MTKTFPTEVVLTMTTGVTLCRFDKMHEMVEFLVDSPVQTLDFACKPFIDQINDVIFKQHPQLRACDASRVNKDNWEEFRDRMIQEFGPKLSLVQSKDLC